MSLTTYYAVHLHSQYLEGHYPLSSTSIRLRPKVYVEITGSYYLYFGWSPRFPSTSRTSWGPMRFFPILTSTPCSDGEGVPAAASPPPPKYSSDTTAPPDVGCRTVVTCICFGSRGGERGAHRCGRPGGPQVHEIWGPGPLWHLCASYGLLH